MTLMTLTGRPPVRRIPLHNKRFRLRFRSQIGFDTTMATLWPVR